ncbi:MAG: hypothetical protein CME62_08000 [Halobacteriovoraceae bacterium]|nr:hypothetical protein [Halobacteriovoraceae bacterium]|tara:strand:- start:2092 stop:4407 length:2316 start_codon:yes stop_codon:yes gene_type:complete
MKQKVLKIELIGLFVLSLITLVYYFFGSQLPDNSLSISSSSTDYFSPIYYLSSLLAEISYYTGPWLVIPTLAFAFLYSFVLSKRFKRSDFVIAFLLIAVCYSFTYFLKPGLLGSGLFYISQKYVDLYVSFFGSLFLSVVIFYLTLRGTFFVLLRQLQKRLEKFGFVLIKRTQLLTQNSKQFALTYKQKVNEIDFKSKTKSMLKSGSGDLPAPARDTQSSFEDIDGLVEEEFTQTAIITKNDVEETHEEVSDGQDTEVKSATENKPAPKVRKKTNSKFFKSHDLIDCISASINHNQMSGPDDNYFTEIIKAIESKLLEFKLEGKIINILKGPVVDTFELELGSGVKVSKVTNLSDDIGLALNGAPIRIVYPMRGRSTIGIEVPRLPRDFIYLDEVLKSKPFNDSTQRLPIAMGKNAFGEVKVVDLAGMPHMLVAGATGAGKSVFINALLVSLIIKKSPRQLKLVLIDPKQLELALYQDLPHLMLPVITDPKSSAVALLWAVQEMERRYSILKELGVKGIEGFNKKIKTCDPSLLLKINEYYEDQEDEGYELPYIVIVIDEFADLILSKSGKEIELNVNRLAAKARAAGIHLVVATQRPSTDVVTGVVKANFPTRVAFRVSTGHDSKTILDQYGAEKLLGKGDMLYKQGVELLRMHSSFVEEDEIEGLLEKLASIPQAFNPNAVDFLENGGDELFEDDAPKSGPAVTGTSDDPMYQEALDIVYESGSASASMLQRRLRVGYNRAANLVEEMERNGIVGPAQGSKPRKVIATRE